MSITSIYGEAFGKRIGAASASYATRSLRNSMIGVTELRYENPTHELSVPPAVEDAFVAAYFVTRLDRYDYFECGRSNGVRPIHSGHTIIYDVKRKPTFHLNTCFHSVHFCFPRAALDAVADEAECARFEDLSYNPGHCFDDPVVSALTGVILPAFARPEASGRLFLDNVLIAMGHHVACKYGGMKNVETLCRGGLAKWQERRAKELLSASLTTDLSLSELASECGLSQRHFGRAFKKSVGLSPHRWLTTLRLERAKGLLADTKLSLTEIALDCGFADHSHFTRTFSTAVGCTPGAWRKAFCPAPPPASSLPEPLVVS